MRAARGTGDGGLSSRERKRAERRKRKGRSGAAASAGEDGGAHPPEKGDAAGLRAEAGGAGDSPEPLAAAGPPGADGATGNGAAATVEDVAAEAERRGISRSQVRNERAREGLEPLAAGERPTVVAIGALISLAIALSILVAYVAGVKVGVEGSGVDQRPNALQVFPPAILFLVMAWGMWGARYWAVLGFQAIMAIIMIGAFLALIAATTVFKAVSAVVILAGAGALFWFTVKALARIQMPSPGDR